MAAMTTDTHNAFKQLHAASLREGALDHKTKELIAVACSITRLCEGCIQHHVKAGLASGMTEADLREVVDVCVLMGGGPASTYGRKAIEAFRALAAPASA